MGFHQTSVKFGRQRGLDPPLHPADNPKTSTVTLRQSPRAEVSPEAQTIQALSALLDRGRWVEAIGLAQTLTQRYPHHPFAWTALGAAYQQLGRDAEALATMQQAATLSPNDAHAHRNLAVVLKKLGRLQAAQASYQRAVQLKPDFVEAHNNLGVVLHDLGRPDEAETAYRRVLALQPNHLQAHDNLAAALRDLGRLSEAQDWLRRLLALKPDSAQAHGNLALLQLEMGQLDEALQSCQRALTLAPERAEFHNTLALTLLQDARLVEAEASCRRALQCRTEYWEACNTLGMVLSQQGRLFESEQSFRRAVELAPAQVAVHTNLGGVLKDLGRLDEALACYRRALQINPKVVDTHTSLLFVLNYHPDKSAQEIYAAYQGFEHQFGQTHRACWRAHDNDHTRDRRLKVGYVSPALRQHSSRHFLEPLLAQHDHGVVELYAYAELTREDAVTARYRGYVDHWVNTKGLSDEALAQRIRDDGIDILIDVAGHTAGNRLQVFARKPAPVSLHWLDFGYTTGLSAIDYYLTDWPTVPHGSEALFSETPWRLDGPGLVYRPAEGMGEVSPLPAQQKGQVTFGSLTRAVRINHRTVRVWAELLKRVPNARLVIDSGDYRTAAMQDELANRFAQHGIERARLDIGYHSPPWDVLRQIDISLDCFPHNSGTTLFESLYLGVPFVTLAGRPSVGTLGSAILQGLGHPEWVAQTEDEYIGIAVAMASDLPKLATLRAGLRSEMQGSALMDEAGFARRVEGAYRGMFQHWSKSKATP
ncbi:MAG: tetratricopeptide repeat protein [Rhodoferax sp.]|nr:tetratricopeptide repeat protein [Rhodoferax sp.]